jgi:hypothetical protein
MGDGNGPGATALLGRPSVDQTSAAAEHAPVGCDRETPTREAIDNDCERGPGAGDR